LLNDRQCKILQKKNLVRSDVKVGLWKCKGKIIIKKCVLDNE